MECTGRYHEPVVKTLSEAGLFVCAVNPHLIKNFGNNSIRKVISDPADAKKIARYTLYNWAELRQYSSMDNTYPGVNKLFDSPVRDDGSEKWVDFAYSFWHVDCVRKIGLKTFTERYQAFCKKL